MSDPSSILQRAGEQLRQVEQLFCGKGGIGEPLFDASIWKDLQEATTAMAQRSVLPATGGRPGPAEPPPFSPPVDIFVTPDTVVLNATVPGITSSEDLQVSVIGEQRLRLKGNIAPHPLEGVAKSAVVEQPHGPFERTVNLPVPIRARSARCVLSNGQLEVWLERAGEQETPVSVMGWGQCSSRGANQP